LEFGIWNFYYVISPSPPISRRYYPYRSHPPPAAGYRAGEHLWGRRRFLRDASRCTKKDFLRNNRIRRPLSFARNRKSRTLIRFSKISLMGFSPQKFILFPLILTKKERAFFFLFFCTFLCSSLLLAGTFYFSVTKEQPAFGGTWREGIVGQPRFLNPIYAYAYDGDRDITELLFAGLMKYDPQGKLIPDLAESYEIKDGGKTYEFTLRDAVWEDGTPITADDVIFTVQTIQDPTVQSPLRGSWLGVEIQKLSEKRIAFRLQKPYAGFLELTTLKIAPLHLWRDVQPEAIPLSEKNLEPFASGPYRIKIIEKEKSGKITSIQLERNPKYFGQKPFLEKLIFMFFNSEAELVTSAQSKGIDAFAPQISKRYLLPYFQILRFNLPRYFAVFLNEENSEILKQQEVREALSYATDRERIIKDVFAGEAIVPPSPLLPELFGLREPSIQFSFNPDLARELLDRAGFTFDPETRTRIQKREQQPSFQFKSDLQVGSKGKEVEELQKCLAKDSEVYPERTVNAFFGEQTKAAVIRFQEKYRKEILIPAGLKRGNGKVGPATRAQLNALCFPKKEEKIPLSFTLVTTSEPPLSKIAKLLQEQWGAIGIQLTIREVSSAELVRDFIKTRNYELLLFGQVLGATPDPYPFWHSNQRKDPGLNLSSFASKEADTKLQTARESQDDSTRKRNLEEVQDILLKYSPAVFLARPYYLYFVSPKIKGIQEHFIADPSKRFIGIENWYVKTRRVFQ
jgi:ABC-type transport system substrate-binding protein